MRARRQTNRVVAAVMAVGLLLSLVPHAVAAAPATFGTPTADSTFGTGIVFKQPITIDQPIGRVEILLTFADAVGPTVFEVPGVPAGSSATLTYTLDTSGNDHLIPHTPIVARWRVISADQPSEVGLGPELRVVYEDDRFTWKTASDDIVRVHWYEGDAAFGAKALKLGADEVRETSKLLGVTETEPIDFFVYASVDDFYGAIGPGAHENVAGSAYANIRTLLGLIPPDQINDSLVAVRIPHEFVHLVFDTASKNPYHSPPRWLNEGLAVYQSEGFGSSESVAAVEFMIRTHGPDALVTLIRSYAEGRTDDEAFTDALGLDMTAFGDTWFKDVDATPKTKSGPQPAPPGPVPAEWTGAAPGGQASGRPASQGPAAGASGGPTVTPAPGATGEPAGGDGATLVGILVAIGVIVVLVAVALAARRRQASARSP